jgi:hypothetical protein
MISALCAGLPTTYTPMTEGLTASDLTAAAGDLAVADFGEGRRPAPSAGTMLLQAMISFTTRP